MFDIRNALTINKLFQNFTNQEINQFLVSSQYKTRVYQSEQVIAMEGEAMTEIGLVLDGVIEVQKNYPFGKTVIINQLQTGDIFGEVAIFSNQHTYPSTIFSSTNARIMFINKEHIVKICLQNEKFLKNILQLLSAKILTLDHQLRILSGETIRQKISFYLLEQYQRQNTLRIPVILSRQKMAEQFGITRPSLSRELSRMKHEGLIDLKEHLIIIKDLPALEHSV